MKIKHKFVSDTSIKLIHYLKYSFVTYLLHYIFKKILIIKNKAYLLSRIRDLREYTEFENMANYADLDAQLAALQAQLKDEIQQVSVW